MGDVNERTESLRTLEARERQALALERIAAALDTQNELLVSKWAGLSYNEWQQTITQAATQEHYAAQEQAPPAQPPADPNRKPSVSSPK